MSDQNDLCKRVPVAEFNPNADYDILGDLFSQADRKQAYRKPRKRPGKVNPRRWWPAVPLPFDSEINESRIEERAHS